MRNLALALFVILLAQAIAGCVAPSPSTPVDGGSTTVESPSRGLATVKGQLVVRDSDQAYVTTLYLARVIRASQAGSLPLVALSEQTDPRTVSTPGAGDFRFRDVPPGSYALVIWTPVGNTVVEQEGSHDYLLIDLVPDQALDVGKVPVN